MQYIEFGSTGVQLSEMCLGTMMFGDRCDASAAARIVSAAFDAGVNFIDTAAMYCDGLTEEILGRILATRGRNQFFIETKVHKGIDKQSIVESLNESLDRLKMDYVDLYLIHWPQKGMYPEEVMRALQEVVQSGKTRFVGCCNYPAWLLAYHNAIAERHGWPRLISNQIPYNLIERGAEVEVLPQAVAAKIAITTYRPLVMGLLSGKYVPEQPLPRDSRATTDERIGDWLRRFSKGISAFLEFARELNVTPVELAISWVRHSPAVSCPIVGVSSLEQLQVDIKAFDFDLSDEQYTRLTDMLDTGVKEESGGAYKNLRRELELLKG